MNSEKAIELLVKHLLAMDRLGVAATLEKCVASAPPCEVVDQVLVPALERMGDGWDSGEVALAQVYMGARICEQVVSRLFGSDANPRSQKLRIAIATLIDHHALGRQMVTLALRSGGWRVEDLKRGSPEEIAERAVNAEADVLFISVLMLPSALRVRELVTALRERGSKAKVLVGGAPFRFDTELWREVGADGFGRSTGDALTLAAEAAREQQGGEQ